MRGRLNLNSVLVGIVITLQGWILLEIISLRDRLTKVETKIEWWRGSGASFPVKPNDNL